MDSPAPYLIIREGVMFYVEFLPQEGEFFVDRSRLPRKGNALTRRLFPQKPELAYGLDGKVYEVAFEALPEHLQLGEKPRSEYDWWDWLSHGYDLLTGRGGSRPVPVRCELTKPAPYDFAELRAHIAAVLRKDSGCYGQFGVDTAKAAEHVEKTKDLPGLLTYFARRKFLWMAYDDGEAKARRERLKQWCSAAAAAGHGENP